jgi:DNA-binding MarR family transcriptional regulator
MTTDKKDEIKQVLEIDRIIHEPARFLVLTYLYVVENADFLFLMNQTGLTRGNLSSHLSKLEAAGYIQIQKEFVNKLPHTLLSLTPAGRTAFEEYRKQMQQVLGEVPG